MELTLEAMNEYTRHQTVERLRKRLPAGTRIVLLEMDDPQAPPSGRKAQFGVWTTCPHSRFLG
jgi:hypothetical protein